MQTLDFDGFLADAWDRHAAEPEVVAARLASDGLGLAGTGSQLAALANLVFHVHGEHLGQFAQGRALLAGLRLNRAADDGVARTIRRYEAALDVGAGAALEDALRDGLAEGQDAPWSASDRIRIAALSAATLANRDTPRALALFESALAEAGHAQPPADDPVHRALAVTGNNLASALEELPQRSPAQRELMIRAATAARAHWALAGGWLETERAEYRLCMTWLAAGDPQLAAHHARACLALVQAHDAPALEHFFAWEAVARAAHAAAEASTQASALAQAEQWFAALDEGDRGWCRASLDGLRA